MAKTEQLEFNLHLLKHAMFVNSLIWVRISFVSICCLVLYNHSALTTTMTKGTRYVTNLMLIILTSVLSLSLAPATTIVSACRCLLLSFPHLTFLMFLGINYLCLILYYFEWRNFRAPKLVSYYLFTSINNQWMLSFSQLSETQMKVEGKIITII